jgi:hypothetical protein
MKNLTNFLFGVQLIKATIFVTKKFGISKSWSNPKVLARDKVHLNYGKSQTIRISQ